MTEDMLQTKRRVCHISTAHPANDVRIFYRECGSLAQAGYETHLVIPSPESKVENGVHVHGIPKAQNRFTRIFLMPWLALAAAVKTKAELYHYHDPELIFIGFILRWVFFKKVVFDIHEAVARQIKTKEWLPPWSRKIVAVTYKIVEKIFTAGQALVIANEPSMEDYPATATLVRNYPLLDEERLAKVEQNEKRSEIPSLIYIGSLDVNRGAFVYMELARKLSEAGRDFTLMFIGTYSPGLREQLEVKINAYNLQDKVTLADRIPYEKVMELVSQSWIGLCLFLPSPHNVTSLSTKLLEYMMNGSPVLASNFEFWKPYIEGTGAGRMADPENIDDVAHVCEEMLSDTNELEAMRKRGIEAVRTKFNWSTEFRELLRCYDDLLS